MPAARDPLLTDLCIQTADVRGPDPVLLLSRLMRQLGQRYRHEGEGDFRPPALRGPRPTPRAGRPAPLRTGRPDERVDLPAYGGPARRAAVVQAGLHRLRVRAGAVLLVRLRADELPVLLRRRPAGGRRGGVAGEPA